MRLRAGRIFDGAWKAYDESGWAFKGAGRASQEAGMVSEIAGIVSESPVKASKATEIPQRQIGGPKR